MEASGMHDKVLAPLMGQHSGDCQRNFLTSTLKYSSAGNEVAALHSCGTEPETSRGTCC